MNRVQNYSAVIASVLLWHGMGVVPCWGTEPASAPRDTREGEIRTAIARVIYPERTLGAGVMAERDPGPFTVPKGYVATNLKYHWADPKTGRESDRITGGTIYSVTEKRYISEAKDNPNILLPPGEYKVVSGGMPGAMGVLTYSVIREDLALPTDNTQPPKKNSHDSFSTRPPKNTPIPEVKSDGKPDTGFGTVNFDWLYQPVHLPQKYIPDGYRYYPDDKVPIGDPPIGEGSQTLWYGIPLKKKNGQPSSSSGEHPYSVYIDGLTVYKTLAGAKQLYRMSAEMAADRLDANFGDEAYVDFKGDDGSMFREYRTQKGILFRRDLNIRNIRVGRTVFGLRIVGSQVSDYVRQGGKTRDFVAHPTPTREELTQLAELFVSRIREFSQDKGWLHD